ENTPTADDHETIADQTQLDPLEDVSLASEETNPGETGEQVETELLSELVSGGPETKEDETGEAVDDAAATEIGPVPAPAFELTAASQHVPPVLWNKGKRFAA
ncbi:hypothetical protein Q9966_011715, partial [Columba livia]